MDIPLDTMEPLVLADGTRIDPSNGEVVKAKRRNNFVEVPSHSEAQALVVKSRRSLNELPSPPRELQGVAIIAFYTLFGLSDQDIALAIDGKLTVEQIARVRRLDAYREFMDSAKENIINSSADAVREVFETHAKGAALNIVDMAQSENDALAFAASKDILDRAGHRPADIVEHRHRMDDALNIVITHKEANQQAPIIDLEPSEIHQ